MNKDKNRNLIATCKAAEPCSLNIVLKKSDTIFLPDYIKEYYEVLYKLKKYTIMNDTNNYVVFKEKYFEYDELPVLNNNIKLNGYFQSYKYFEKFARML